jgi:hypothetical protein
MCESLTYHMYTNAPPTFFFYCMVCKLLSTLLALRQLLRMSDFHTSVSLCHCVTIIPWDQTYDTIILFVLDVLIWWLWHLLVPFQLFACLGIIWWLHQETLDLQHMFSINNALYSSLMHCYILWRISSISWHSLLVFFSLCSIWTMFWIFTSFSFMLPLIVLYVNFLVKRYCLVSGLYDKGCLCIKIIEINLYYYQIISYYILYTFFICRLITLMKILYVNERIKRHWNGKDWQKSSMFLLYTP